MPLFENCYCSSNSHYSYCIKQRSKIFLLELCLNLSIRKFISFLETLLNQQQQLIQQYYNNYKNQLVKHAIFDTLGKKNTNKSNFLQKMPNFKHFSCHFSRISQPLVTAMTHHRHQANLSR